MDILKSLGTEAAESDTSRPLFSDHESVDELEVKEERNDREDAAMEQDRDGDDEGIGGEDRDGDDEGTGGEDRDGDDEGTGAEDTDGDDEGTGGEDRDGDDEGTGGEDRDGDDEGTGGEDRDGDDEGTGGEDRDGDDEGTGGEDTDGDDKGPDVDRDGDDEGTGLASRAKRPRLGEPKRKPRQCPLCEGMFVQLATHLTDSHNVANRENRLQLLNQARTQKVQRSRSGKGAEGRTLRDCPVPGCPSTALLRIDQHLRRCHGFEKSSQEYMLWLAAARATVPETDPTSPEKAKPSAHSKIPKKLDDKAVLDRFLSYEAAMVGGTGPNLKQAEQHRRQVEILLQRLEVNSIAGLVDPLSVQRTANLLREDKKAPKTISSYLLSMKLFCRFLRLNEEVSRSAGVKPKAAKWTDLATEQFQVALRPEIDRHGRKIASQIKDSILSSAEIGKLKRLATKEGIAMAENTDSILQSSVAMNRFRDLLMAMIVISTGHRSGVLLNLTAEEFSRVERFCLQDGSVRWTIKISDHKTLKSHGPTHITIDQTTYNLMLVYFNVVRPHHLRGRVATEAEERDTPFFLSNNGNRVRRLKALMVAVGLSLGVENFSPLNLRKTAATLAVQLETAAGRSRVAQAMSHTEYTQGRYYNERLAGEQACIAGSTVAGLLNGVRMTIC
ncbi:uncharacterized protein [Apostichopus japonicus]|uniref:uncharacterized protein n=1 Tax=Stichopus japonicus TaxID=307972 RepID=UPI003AB1BC1C